MIQRIAILKKGIGIKNEKLWKQVRDQIVWKQVEDSYSLRTGIEWK